MADLPASSLWLVASSDEAISSIADQVRSSATLRQGDVVFHCSGAISSDVLWVARQSGALVASVHPIRSFADPEIASKSFAGTYCALEGDEGARVVLEKIFIELGATVFVIPTASKMLCHAGHVFASNYLIAVLAVAQQLYESAGIPEELSRAFVGPLVRGSVENFLQVGGVNALTGPIARGDALLVKEQREKLAKDLPAIGDLYQALGAHALELAIARGLSRAEADAVAAALRRER